MSADFPEVISSTSDQLFAFFSLCIWFLAAEFLLPIVSKFCLLAFRFTYFRILNLKCNERDMSTFIRREGIFCVEQLLSNLDGGEVHSSIFDSPTESMITRTFSRLRKLSRFLAWTIPKRHMVLTLEKV